MAAYWVVSLVGQSVGTTVDSTAVQLVARREQRRADYLEPMKVGQKVAQMAEMSAGNSAAYWVERLAGPMAH